MSAFFCFNEFSLILELILERDSAGLASATPKRNPPRCPECAIRSPDIVNRAKSSNRTKSMTTEAMDIGYGKKRRRTFSLGNRIARAPRMPKIAPEAPTRPELEPNSTIEKIRAEPIPDRKYTNANALVPIFSSKKVPRKIIAIMFISIWNKLP